MCEVDLHNSVERRRGWSGTFFWEAGLWFFEVGDARWLCRCGASGGLEVVWEAFEDWRRLLRDVEFGIGEGGGEPWVCVLWKRMR